MTQSEHPRPGPDTGVGQPSQQVPPGETPPGESCICETVPEVPHNPTTGWSTGPLVLIAVIVACFLAFFVGYLIHL